MPTNMWCLVVPCGPMGSPCVLNVPVSQTVMVDSLRPCACKCMCVHVRAYLRLHVTSAARNMYAWTQTRTQTQLTWQTQTQALQQTHVKICMPNQGAIHLDFMQLLLISNRLMTLSHGKPFGTTCTAFVCLPRCSTLSRICTQKMLTF